MDLYEVMRTTFAARDFEDEPVPDDVIRRILDHGRFAPSGGNRQGWKVIVVREEATRDAVLPLIRPTMQRYLAQIQAGEAPWNTVHPTRLSQAEIAAVEVPDVLIRRLTHAPVLLFAFVDLSVVASFDAHLDHVGVISGASVYPFVWNILLAARNEGYGGTLTTFVGAREKDLQDLLGVPEHMAFAAMIPLGKPRNQLTRLKRKPVDEFATLERWDGPRLGSSG
jgi:nitroreductase